MKHVFKAATLTALLSLGLACPPALAQDYDAELADRLREAIDAQGSTGDSLGLTGEAFALPEQGFLAAEELDDLVAPVALYPDALLAQVLVAATYPFQIAKADQLIDASSELTDAELSDALAAQEWDPSILVLLSGFPTVIGRMAEDLAWTERLGLAMVEQDEDVLAAVQRMRARAEATGYLTSNDAQIIERQEDQIYIRPADPNVIYVPSYDTAAAFTSQATAQPYYAPQPQDYLYAPQSGGYAQPQPGFSTRDALIGGAVGFGSALLVNELFGNKDEDDDNEGWDDYWDRQDAIDWRDREVYPRAYRREIRADAREAAAWSAERDRYWDRSERRWRREDAEALRDYDQERRDALERLERRERQATRDLRNWREGLREEERRREARDERRDERVEDARRQAERDAALRDARQDARQDERRDSRQEERQDARQEERREQRQDARQEERAREAAREQERQRAPQQERQRAAQREQEREREQRQAREAEREQERERERRRAREAERQQERAREQERAQEAARQQQRSREGEGERARRQENAREGGQQERAREAQREQQRARSPERRSDEQRREERRERRRECREGDENCRKRN